MHAFYCRKISRLSCFNEQLFSVLCLLFGQRDVAEAPRKADLNKVKEALGPDKLRGFILTERIPFLADTFPLSIEIETFGLISQRTSISNTFLQRA